MAPSKPPRWGSIAALLFGTVLTVILIRNAIAQEATPQPIREPTGVIADGGCEPSDECRAKHGNIFFGRVAEVVDVGTFPGELNLTYVVYEVDVESTLRHILEDGPEGRAAEGRVRIEVSGIDLPVKAKGRSAPLVVGERYMLFAGLDLGNGYIVDSEVGFLLVGDDKEAAKLRETFAPLIVQEQKRERAALTTLAETARQAPKTPPTAEISPDSGPAGSEVVVSGSGFTQGTVLILWDESNPLELPQVQVQPDGTFSLTFAVPKGLAPGPQKLSVEGTGSDVVELRFDVEK